MLQTRLKKVETNRKSLSIRAFDLTKQAGVDKASAAAAAIGESPGGGAIDEADEGDAEDVDSKNDDTAE